MNKQNFTTARKEQWACGKCIEMSKRTNELIKQLREISSDLANPAYNAKQKKGLRNIRKSVVMQLRIAIHNEEMWLGATTGISAIGEIEI